MNALLNPTILFALVLGVGYAALFHLWTGRTLRDLAVYLLASFVGVGLGQWIGQIGGLDFLRIGQLHILETTVGALLALILVRTLHPERSLS